MFAVTAKRNTIVFAVTALATIAIDQGVKAIVAATLEPGQSVRVFAGLRFTYIRNTGVAFGLFAGAGQILFWGALVLVAAMFVWFYRSRNTRGVLSFVALGLMVGGALGNLADRLLRGRVVDFVDFGWWPVFNFADLAIVAGVIILIVVVIRDLYGGEESRSTEVNE